MKTVATTGAGVPELVDAIWQFRAHSQRTQAARRRDAERVPAARAGRAALHGPSRADVLAAGELGAIVDRIAAREIDPYTAANDLLQRRALSPIANHSSRESS